MNVKWLHISDDPQLEYYYRWPRYFHLNKHGSVMLHITHRSRQIFSILGGGGWWGGGGGGVGGGEGGGGLHGCTSYCFAPGMLTHNLHRY